MNEYEQRQDERRKRYVELAQKNREEAERKYEQSQKAVEMIPLGQPILVGHHSEGMHRAAIKRSNDAMRKALDINKKADYYDRKAEAVGRGGVSSDDSEAVEKLRNKLAKLEAERDQAKIINTHYRKHGTFAGCPGVSDERVPKLDANMQTIQAMGHKAPYPAYWFTNMSGNIRATRKRIEELSNRATSEPVEIIGGFWLYREDPAENRVMFEFDGKPPLEVRDILKFHGFKWSPNRGAWVRMLNGSGRMAGEIVRGKFEKTNEESN